MQWIGKAVGGLIGLMAGGPVGAAIGVMIGHQFDGGSTPTIGRSPGVGSAAGATATQIGDRFFRAAFQVMGHVAKADGRVSEQEIQAARAVMSELRLTPDQVQVAIACFTQGKAPQFALYAALDGLYRACGGRPDLMRAFVEIQMRAALMGNDLQPTARTVLQNIATRLGLGGMEFAHIEAVLRMRRSGYAGGRAGASAMDEELRLAQAYKVLECTPQNTKEELSLAYRRQLSRHHPDKLKANGLPESMIEHAKQRTQQIIEAWELVRERRGI
ncbi:MAG TPA: co-chaperone DjlA [Steroidobacteraceae bacterium]|jgi:DnaJ like chaperone protein|nr:co-chaperone DjlA [Steroidobacteraceae bacterium]